MKRKKKKQRVSGVKNVQQTGVKAKNEGGGAY